MNASARCPQCGDRLVKYLAASLLCEHCYQAQRHPEHTSAEWKQLQADYRTWAQCVADRLDQERRARHGGLA
jgi:hypothetical protein